MSQDIEHMFDSNACLTRRQVKDYISAEMSTEEIAAVERHFSTCPLCREAMDGFLAHSDRALEALASQDTQFLKDQIGHIQEQHPAKQVPVLTKPARKRRGLRNPPNFNSFVPVILIAGMFILFQYELGKPVPHKALTAAIQTTPVHAAPVVTRGLKEARTEPAPPPVQPKRFPEAPVGRNMNMSTVNAVAVRTDSGIGHIVVAPRIVGQPIAAQPVGTTTIGAPGVASVSASPAGSLPKSDSKRVAARPSTVSKQVPETVQKQVTVGPPHDDFFDEPDIVKVPPKPIGPQPEPAPAQSRPGPSPEKPKNDTGGH